MSANVYLFEYFPCPKALQKEVRVIQQKVSKMLQLLQNGEIEVCRVDEGCGGSGKAVPVFACSGNEGITVVVCSAKWHTYFKAMIETR